MQAKHLIIAALAGLVILLGFNIINSSRHEKSRAVLTDNAAPAADTNSAVVPAADGDKNSIASKPLGEQPKAILDDATNKIDQAQEADQARLAQMDSEAQ